jgi:hypothetical protein
LLSGISVTILLVVQPSAANRARCRLGGLVLTAIFLVLRVARTLHQSEGSNDNFALYRHSVHADGQSSSMKVIKVIVLFPEYQVLTFGKLNINVSSIVVRGREEKLLRIHAGVLAENDQRRYRK